MQWAHRKNSGFTIVELLIVIVVIAILAAITIVAYTGIQERAQSSSAQSAVAQVSKKLAAYAIEHNDTYPTNLTAIDLNTADYSYSSNGTSYCLTKATGSEYYFQTSTWPSPVRGTCYGMVGWYPFNGDTNDYSGTGNHSSSAYNLTASTGQNGSSNGAYNFDGTSSRINVAYAPSLNIGTPGMTISAWVNIQTINGTSAVVSRNSPYLLWLNNTGTLPSVNTGLIPSGTWYWTSAAQSDFNYNDWEHLVLTYDGTTRKIYINSQLAKTDTQFSGNIVTNTNTLNIGYDACCGGRYYYDGSMDDIRLYSRALTELEIQQLYIAGAM